MFDYVIAGAGPAGCVLANRLSADPRVEVLLVEAGDRDANPLIAMPMGFSELLDDPATAWHFPTQQGEYWVRGRTLGGSSAVNGMVYNRGQPADYDELERLGNPGWGWDEMLPVFGEIEANGLHVSTVDGSDPLREDVLTAGTELGWSRVHGINESDEERIGSATVTIRDGRRCSAADAFLHPVLDRPNLTVALNTVVDRLVLEGDRAVGVQGRGFEARATREVILATGALATPKLLELSGIGPADALRSAGVDVVADRPNVGARLREHRVFILQLRLADDLGYNTLLSTESGRQAAAAQYQESRQGPLAAPPCDVVGFFRTGPEADRPDAQVQLSPFSLLPPAPGKSMRLESEPGMICIGFILRPDSEGSLHISSADPDAPPAIYPNYLATEHDRAAAVGIFRTMRRLCATRPLAERIAGETVPGDGVQADEQILDAWRTMGGCGYHTIGTCAMGPDDDDVVDPRLRVRGVSGLRIVDASVLPVMVAGNLNGPVTALAWRAADFIAEEA